MWRVNRVTRLLGPKLINPEPESFNRMMSSHHELCYAQHSAFIQFRTTMVAMNITNISTDMNYSPDDMLKML